MEKKGSLEVFLLSLIICAYPPWNGRADCFDQDWYGYTSLIGKSINNLYTDDKPEYRNQSH